MLLFYRMFKLALLFLTLSGKISSSFIVVMFISCVK